MKNLVLLLALLQATSALPQFNLGGFLPTRTSHKKKPTHATPRFGGLPTPPRAAIQPMPRITPHQESAPPATKVSTPPATKETSQVAAPILSSTIVPSPTVDPTGSLASPPPPPASADPRGPACKNIAGDPVCQSHGTDLALAMYFGSNLPAWPNDAVWKAELPGVLQIQSKPDELHPNFHFSARNHGDVQAAINFAVRHNVRLSVINSGHDFLGRNDAPTGLGVSTNKLKGVYVHQDFDPTFSGAREVDYDSNPVKGANVIKPEAGRHAFVTFGAGVTTQELNNALEPSGLFTHGAAHGEVAVAGGWAQAGGHGPLTSSYGLGVDHAVEYQVVTPDGRLRVANAVSEPDLFWALRGGGAGTFGVVVQATVMAYLSPKMTIANWWINTTNTSPGSDAIYEPAAYLHSLFPSLNARGVQGYYYIFPNAISGIFVTHGEDAGASKAKSIWSPVLGAMSTMKDMGDPITEYSDYSNFKGFYDAAFGTLEGMKAMPAMSGHSKMSRRGGLIGEAEGRALDLFNRHGPAGDDESVAKIDTGASPSGIVPMDSHLLDRAALTSPKLAQALENAMPKLKNAMLRGHLVGGSAVNLENEGTSVNPSWRNAYVHIIGTGVGVPNIQSLKELAPDMGAYVNEALWREKNWKMTFWGSNYERLSLIKSELDPYGVFYVSPGINADHFSLQNGRLCRKDPFIAANDQVPSGDSTAIGKHIESGNDVAMAWPKDQVEADANLKDLNKKLSNVSGLKEKGHDAAAMSAAAAITPLAHPGPPASSTTLTDVSVTASVVASPEAAAPTASAQSAVAAPLSPLVTLEASKPSSEAKLSGMAGMDM